MLQRGRGQGFRDALKAPKSQSIPMLRECIANDPRLDSQVECRSGYYASLAVELGLDLAPLAQHLKENDDTEQSLWITNLTVGTLGELAKRGSPNAAPILCDYIVWGQWWDDTLEELIACNDPGVSASAARAIEQRFPAENGLAEALEWFTLSEEPWLTLSRYSPRIAHFAAKPGKRDAASSTTELDSAELTSLSIRQILELADERNRHRLRKVIAQIATPADVDLLIASVSLEKPFMADVALAGLAKVATPRIFGWLLDFWSANPDMPSYLQYRAEQAMIALPAHITLPLAREYFLHESDDKRSLAEDLFAAHAQLEDVPLLRTAIGQALADDLENCYRLCDLVEAFHHLPGIGPVPELSDVFVQDRYSYGRMRAAKAIQTTAPDLFQNSYAFECLWDCEEETRTLGARFVPITVAHASDRLRHLAADIWEDGEVRAAAANRCASVGQKT
jgi:hypothetical protein